MVKAGLTYFKNPIFILTMIYGSASMGLFTSFTFYYFQSFLQKTNILYFFYMYIGIIIANLIGLLFGFNIFKPYVRLLIYVSCIIQILSFPLIYVLYQSHILLTVLIVMITGFFDALIGLYLIPRANRVKSYSHRLRQNILLWGFLYVGMSVFAISFIINIALSFVIGMVSTIIGSIGLYFLIKEDKDQYIAFTKVPLRKVFRSDYLAHLVLFTMYFMFFFSMISIIAFTTYYKDSFPGTSLIVFLAPLLLVNAIIPLTVWYALNKRFPLRTIFNLTYVVGSISLILIYNNPTYLIYAYAFELWTWSVFQIYIFVNIGDSFPGLRNIQPVNFWWLMLAVSVGLGVILPVLIPERNLLFSLMLIAMLVSIILFTFLKSFKQPCTIYLLLVLSKHGETLFKQSFSNFEFNAEFLSGVFKTISVLFTESFKSSTKFIRSIEYENKTLILYEARSFYCVAVVDRYDNLIRANVNEIANLFEVSNLFKSRQDRTTVKVNLSDLPRVLQYKISALEL